MEVNIYGALLWLALLIDLFVKCLNTVVHGSFCANVAFVKASVLSVRSFHMALAVILFVIYISFCTEH